MASKVKEKQPEKKAPAIAPEIAKDKLVGKVLFYSDTPNKKIKIPGTKLGDHLLKTPPYAEFKDYRFETNSRYVCSVLRRLCSPAGIIEAKA